MLDILENIWNFISTVASYIFDLIEQTIMLLDVAMEAIAIPPAISQYVPTFLAVSMTCVVSVSVIKLIVGR